ncbi:MAG: hypothetical protein GC129_02580 [Proteobacteria bacterium]|nr:hypothetical protein [Pseudomonadota bacterium]
MKNNVFADLQLPMQLIGAADGAVIEVVQEPVMDEVAEPFFGGYADDFLADMGFDLVDELPAQKPLKAKRV